MLIAVSSLECFAMQVNTLVVGGGSGEPIREGDFLSTALQLALDLCWVFVNTCLWTCQGLKPVLPAHCHKARKIYLLNLPCYNIYLKAISLAIFLGVPSELFTQRLAGRDKRLIQRRETLGGAENLNSS